MPATTIQENTAANEQEGLPAIMPKQKKLSVEQKKNRVANKAANEQEGLPAIMPKQKKNSVLNKKKTEWRTKWRMGKKSYLLPITPITKRNNHDKKHVFSSYKNVFSSYRNVKEKKENHLPARQSTGYRRLFPGFP